MTRLNTLRSTALAAAALVAVVLMPAPPVNADDRQLIGGGEAEPYIMFLLDLSGSMNQSIVCSVCESAETRQRSLAVTGDRCTLCAQSCAAMVSGPLRDACLEELAACNAAEPPSCQVACPAGACLPRMIGDDPDSRLRSAKEAIYALMEAEETRHMQFGFGAFGHNGARVNRKHWWYEVEESQADGFPVLENGLFYPAPGDEHVFGEIWNCTESGADGGFNGDPPIRHIGCDADNPADLDDWWEEERVRRWPKLDQDADTDRTFYIRSGGKTYSVLFDHTGAAIPSTAQLELDVSVQCIRGGCTSGAVQTKTLRFRKVDEFVMWDVGEGIRKDAPGVGFFGNGVRFLPAGGQSFEPNNDTANDQYDGQNLKLPTVADPPITRPDGTTVPSRGADFSVGDFVPFDWRDDHRDHIKKMMAPNLWVPGETVPDFQIATYMSDTLDGGIQRPANLLPSAGGLTPAEAALIRARTRPLFARGGTPTGDLMGAFANWYGRWLTVAEGADGDPDLDCRKTYVVVITDGLANGGCTETDPATGECINRGHPACAQAQDLWDDYGIRTFSVAMGRFEGDFLEELEARSGRTHVVPCLAKQGKTSVDDDLDGDGEADGPGPIYPKDKDELVDALTNIFRLVSVQGRSFTAATVPSVQAESTDKLFLTQFNPVDGPVWPGHVLAFVKPLPLDSDNRPDLTQTCAPGDPDATGCFLWDAQTVVTDDQTGNATPVGPNANQRRVYYPLFDAGTGVPLGRRYFEQTGMATPAAEKFDLFDGLGIVYDPLDPASVLTAESKANTTVQTTLAVKSAQLPDGTPVPDFVVGDIFHSDPLLVGGPSNNRYFIRNVGGIDGGTCGVDAGDTDRGYQCFARKQQRRRKVLFAGANDGMVHAFDAGVFIADVNSPTGGEFNNGSGHELFAYIPRPVMPSIHQTALDIVDPMRTQKHRYSVDGKPVAGDVFIDPIHDGLLSGTPPDADEREWRTVLVGGLRRGGERSPDVTTPDGVAARTASGYYALDITVPDPVAEVAAPSPLDNVVDFVPNASTTDPPSCVAAEDGTSLAAGCGSVAYATPLWEFTDTVELSERLPPVTVHLDEDDNGQIDLAPTWSAPNIGRIRVCAVNGTACNPADPDDDDDILDRYVAVFGGGIDPALDDPYERGNWIYMVDIETGEAIYKRSLLGAAPSEPAAVDTNFDGYLDTIYVGTTVGLLYRIDLEPVVGGVTQLPLLEEIDVSVTKDAVTTDKTVVRIDDSLYKPRILFNTNDFSVPALITALEAGTLEDVQSIFFRPSVVFVAEAGRYALAFGTGNREDVLGPGEPAGRFFTFVDDVSPAELKTLDEVMGGPTPLTSTDLIEVSLASAADTDAGSNFLLRDPSAGRAGWWFETTVDERLITDPFAFAGVLFFSTFSPDECNTGTSRIYGLNITNATGLLSDSGVRTRYTEIPDFVTAPFKEQAQTKNPPPTGNTPGQTLDDNLKQIMEELKALYPPGCKFPEGFRIDIKTRTSGTGVVHIAPVPICVMERNFKEF